MVMVVLFGVNFLLLPGSRRSAGRKQQILEGVDSKVIIIFMKMLLAHFHANRSCACILLEYAIELECRYTRSHTSHGLPVFTQAGNVMYEL